MRKIHQPISNIGVVQDYDDNNVSFYDDITLPALTTPTAMDQTVSFYQTIAAYPDSTFASNYPTEDAALKNWSWAPADETAAVNAMAAFPAPADQPKAYITLANYMFNGKTLPVKVGATVALKYITKVS